MIYVPCATGGGGNDFDWEIVNGGLDVVTGHGNGYPTGKVGIGISPVDAKLHVVTTTENLAGYFITTTPSSITNFGIKAISQNSLNNVAIYGNAIGGDYSTGICGRAQNSNDYNCGGFFESTGPSACLNYGVKANAPGSSTSYGIYGSSNNWAGYFVGNVHATGNITQGSDRILKQNITDFTQGLSVISLLKPEAFYFDTVNYPYLNLPHELQYGFTLCSLIV